MSDPDTLVIVTTYGWIRNFADKVVAWCFEPGFAAVDL